MQKKYLALSLLTVMILLFSACTGPQASPTTAATEASVATEAPTEPAVPAEPKFLRLSGGASDFGTIDPSLATQSAEIQIIESTSLGVVRQNETTAEIENAFATSYDVSADGLTYTIKLMHDVPWVHYNADTQAVEVVKACDGTQRNVTAQDFAYGITRTVDPATASDYAYALLPYLAGAAEFNDGTNTDASSVGVKAVDDYTVQYTFKQAAVYNLNLIGLWIAHAEPKWLIKGDSCTTAAADRWTDQEYFEGYGPFTLKEWIKDSNMTLIKNPFWPGNDTVPQAKIDEVQFRFLNSSPALAEFDAGNMDIAGIPSQDWDRIHTDPAYADMIRPVYTIGTEVYNFNTRLAPTDDQRVRLALSLSIDRESLVKNVVKGGIAAQFFTNPGAAGGPKPQTFPTKGVKYDPAKAKELLNSYLTEKNKKASDLKIVLMANSTEGNQKTGEAIVGMWKDVLGIDVTFVTQERKVYLQSRQNDQENVYRSSWVQDYPDANNFLYDVYSDVGAFTSIVDWPVHGNTDGQDTYKPGSNANFDKYIALLKEAGNEPDIKKRMDLYSQAEQILLVDEAVLAPLYWYTDDILIRPEIKDTVSITGYDHWEKWDIQR